MSFENEKKRLAGQSRFKLDDLLTIMKILRAPDGCPWDSVQTHKTIRNDLIEETYEAADAIDSGDDEHLREELGDILLQVIFHSRLAEEDGKFDFSDVVSDISAKLIIRHPHVFGEVKVDGVEGVLTNWDSIKQKTHGNTTLGEALSDVSKTLPSLMRAAKLSHKAVKAGRAEPNPAIGRYSDIPESERAAAIGHDLFEIAGAARELDIEPEQALYDECERFIKNKSE